MSEENKKQTSPENVQIFGTIGNKLNDCFPNNKMFREQNEEIRAEHGDLVAVIHYFDYIKAKKAKKSKTPSK